MRPNENTKGPDVGVGDWKEASKVPRSPSRRYTNVSPAVTRRNRNYRAPLGLRLGEIKGTFFWPECALVVITLAEARSLAAQLGAATAPARG